MVKTLRLVGFGRPLPAVEEAEGIQRHPVHIAVHLAEVPFQQGFHEPIVGRRIFPEPIVNHPLEHEPDLPVRQDQAIFRFPAFLIVDNRVRPQIAAGQQQAPDGAVPIIQLVEDDLFVKHCMVRLPLQQILHHYLHLRGAFTNQFSGQAVGTGVGPISGELSCF